MVDWQAPKTNWYGGTDANGEYHGDRFNAVDFNRIKNNLIYLRDLAIKMYTEFDIEKVSDDKGYADYPYADEINTIESNLDTINVHTIIRDYGTKQTFNDNGAFIDFNELNRIESAELDLYNRLTNEHDGRRMFTWNFGERGGTL